MWFWGWRNSAIWPTSPLTATARIIKGREENTDMYAAIDLVMDKIDMQLKKFRDKQRGVKGDRSRPAAPAAAEAEEARPLPAVRRKQVEVPPLQVDDAVELMQSGLPKLRVNSFYLRPCEVPINSRTRSELYSEASG